MYLILVFEVTDAGEHHSHIILIGGGDDLFISSRAAVLDDGSCSALCCHLDGIVEWNHSIGGEHAAFGGITGSLQGELDADYPVGLARAHTEQCIIFSQDDAIRLDMFHCSPGEDKIAHLLPGWLP